jgi:sterol 14alpha-demethylase
VATSPAVSNRIVADFPDPDGFVPDRYEQPRQEDLINRWMWVPFGAGRRRWAGAAFATADSYRNDHSKMVVQPATPARVRYRKRSG